LFFECPECKYYDNHEEAKFCGGCGLRIQPMMPVRGTKDQYEPYDPEKNYGPEEQEY